MYKPKAYETVTLTPSKSVAGNLRDYSQSYTIVLMPRSKDLCDKIVLYIDWDRAGRQYPTRSLYFSSEEQLKGLIKDLSIAYHTLCEKRANSQIPLAQFRLLKLKNLNKEIQETVMKNWSNGQH